ncbi:MAG: SUMF1/EgtB/PvdO family nonheme iron enzyme, partial [Acidobacteriota bacterium]
HTEAFTYTRQTHEFPPPRLTASSSLQPPTAVPATEKADEAGDVHIPAGTFLLGASPEEPFVLDNEKWAHPVQLRPFAISRTAVRQAEFAAFVDEDGYHRQEFWSEEGWKWRNEQGAEQPVYWRRGAKGDWTRRDFDRWVPLEPDRPVIQVGWHEAQAYCRWAGRRLPSEAEWEAAASASVDPDGPELSAAKRLYPWGQAAPTPLRANLDWQSMGTIDVTALPEGDSDLGCRQMIGNVWEWTSDDFLPFPGFVADPYKEYSEPWFGTHKVLRGGCWATRSRLLRNTWRNFYEPHRRDVWAGFRTCSLES